MMQAVLRARISSRACAMSWRRTPLIPRTPPVRIELLESRICGHLACSASSVVGVPASTSSKESLVALRGLDAFERHPGVELAAARSSGRGRMGGAEGRCLEGSM